MPSKEVDLKSMMQAAHEAASQQNFSLAGNLYGAIIENPEMKDRIDLKVRYAFCLEKTGKIFESIKYYQEAMDSYKGVRELDAIKTLETKISVLRSLSSHHKNAKSKNANTMGSHPMGDASTRDFQGFLALGTRDLNQTGEEAGQGLAQALERSLNTQEKAKQKTAASEHSKYLELGTIDFEHIEEDWDAETLETLKLAQEDKQK